MQLALKDALKVAIPKTSISDAITCFFRPSVTVIKVPETLPNMHLPNTIFTVDEQRQNLSNLSRKKK